MLKTTSTGSVSIQYGDDEIRSNITSALLEKNAAKAHSVEVYCFRSHVFLIGEADAEFRSTAQSLAKGTKGVNDVTTHWFEPGSGDGLQDARLAADIDSKMLFDKELSATRMAVEVVGGQVVLCGIMRDKKSVEKAVAIARGTQGIKNVTSYLIY